MKLLLLRHGLTEGNLRGYYCGCHDIPLAPEGIAALEKLKPHRVYPTVRHWYTSGMTRTEETFSILFGEREHGVLPGMRETDFGDFELRTYDGDLQKDPAYLAWIADSERLPCPHGESSTQVTARALAALEPILHRDEDTLIVTHGGVIGGLMLHWFSEIPHRYACSPPPGGGYTIMVADGVPVSFEPLEN